MIFDLRLDGDAEIKHSNLMQGSFSIGFKK
jgi:hypothetical protein